MKILMSIIQKWKRNKNSPQSRDISLLAVEVLEPDDTREPAPQGHEAALSAGLGFPDEVLGQGPDHKNVEEREHNHAVSCFEGGLQRCIFM